MYKIYINLTQFILDSTSNSATYIKADDNLIVRYQGKSKHLLQYIDTAEKSAQWKQIVILSKDLDGLKTDFWDLYKLVPAAGGLVFNQNKEALFILRRGYWDLPKGKLDPGETIEEAAVREVSEETGIQQIERGDLLLITHHTYKNRKDRRCLKPTYWYLMHTTDSQLIPQTEEDIERAEWMAIDDFLQNCSDATFASILDVVNRVKH
ncbi:MAG: NUDIX hydrolase [Bacteroidota bacterium]